ncbi:MAG: hypothetical protein HYU64_00890 [Armatimonadetes bacterium]|nr:hypothetical protein [Armatimonadota bacterium]
MAMRSVDMQAIVFKMQEVERVQQIAQQQPRQEQLQMAQQALQHSEDLKRQVQTESRAERARIKEEEQKRRRGGAYAKYPAKENKEETSELKPPLGGPTAKIDIRV